MADEASRLVEPEEIEILSSETPVTDGQPTGERAAVSAAVGDDEVDGEMDALARAIEEPEQDSPQNVGNLGVLHTGSRSEADVQVLGGELDTVPTPAPGVAATEDGNQGIPGGVIDAGAVNQPAAGSGDTPPSVDPLSPSAGAGAEPLQPDLPASPVAAVQGAPVIVAPEQANAPPVPEDIQDATVATAPVIPEDQQQTVQIPAVAPVVSLVPAAGAEDNGIALSITLSSPGVGTLDIVISNLPAGTVLSAGSPIDATSWRVSAADLADLQLTPPPNFSGELAVTVTATTTGTAGDTASTVTILPVTVTPIADAPILDVPALTVGAEDTDVPFDIQVSLTDTDGSESLSITVSGLPAGTTLSKGTQQADGSWTLSPGDVPGLTLRPPADFSGTINATVKATSTEGQPAALPEQQSASVDTAVSLTITGVADTPTLVVAPPASGVEDTALPLTISANLHDTSETLSVVISGLPAGATLNQGTQGADGSWTLSPAELAGLQLNPPPNYSGSFDLVVTAVSTEQDGDTASILQTVPVTIAPVVDAPTLTASLPASGQEDTAVPFAIQAALADTDGSESLTITVSGLPSGATLSSGTQQPDGSWSLTSADLPGLLLTPPLNFSGTINATVTATSTEGQPVALGPQSSSEVALVSVSVAGVADGAVVSASAPAAGNEDTHVALNLSASLSDNDGSENVVLTLSGMPAGSTFHLGTSGTAPVVPATVNPDGSVTLAPLPAADVASLSVLAKGSTSGNYAGSYTLTVSAVSVEQDGNVSAPSVMTVPVVVAPVSDGVSTSVQSVSGLEDTTIAWRPVFTLVDRDNATSGDVSGAPGQEKVTTVSIYSNDPDMVGSVWKVALPGQPEQVLTIQTGSFSTGSGSTVYQYKIDIPTGAIQVADGAAADRFAVEGLTVRPSPDSDRDISVVFGVGTEDAASGMTASRVTNVSGTVSVTAVADDIVLTAADVTGKEDQGIGGANVFPLNLSATLNDADGSERVSTVEIMGVPNGWKLAGAAGIVDAGGGVWRHSPADHSGVNGSPTLSGLRLELPEHASTNGPVSLTMRVSWYDPGTEGGPGVSAARTQSTDFKVTVDPVADTPVAVIKTVVGNEDTPLAVYIDPQTPDNDGSEVISVLLSGLPDGVKFGHMIGGAFQELTGVTSSVGGQTIWTLSEAQLSGLHMLPPANSNKDFTFTAEIRTTETGGPADADNVASTVKTISVDLRGVADGSALADGAVITRTGAEDTAIDLNISGIPMVDTDGSEKASYVLDLSALPSGFMLTGVPEQALVPLGGDRWSVAASEAGNLKLMPPKDFSNAFPGGTDVRIGLEIRSTENDGSVRVENHPLDIRVNAVVDAPHVASPDAGREDSELTIPLTVSAGDSDGSETVSSLYLTTHLSGFKVTNGSGAELTWNASLGRYDANLSGQTVLKLLPLDGRQDLGGDGADVPYTLQVTVRDAGGVQATFNVGRTIVVNPVADTPELSASVQGTAPIGSPLDIHLSVASGEVGHLVGGTYVPDGSEKVGLQVSGMVNGVVLVQEMPDGSLNQIGRNNGDGTWTLDPQTLDSLRTSDGSIPDGSIKVWAPWGEMSGGGTYTPVSSLTLGLKAIAVEPDGTGADRVASDETTLNLNWNHGGGGGHHGGGNGNGNGNDGSVHWGGDGVIHGVEDVPVTSLNLGNMPTDVAEVVISGVPAGASFSAGTDMGNGVWKIAAADIPSLVFTPPEDLGGSGTAVEGLNPVTPSGFSPPGLALGLGKEMYGGTIILTVEGHDSSGNPVAGGAFIRAVSLVPEADAPTLSGTPLSGSEDAPLSLSGITVTTNDVDGSETASALIKVPQGFVLSVDAPPLRYDTVGGGDGQPAFALNAGGAAVYAVYSVAAADIPSLTLVRDPSMPDAEHYSGPLKIYVTGVATELEGGQASVEQAFTLDVAAVADGAALSAAPATGTEDGGAIALNLSASLIDGSETLTSLAVLGADASKVTFVDGAGQPVSDLSSLTLAQVQDLHVLPAANVGGDVSFVLKAVTADGADTKETQHVVTVHITPVADMPSVVVTPAQSGPFAFSGNEDTAIALDIAASLTDTDGSESLSLVLDIPVGATLVHVAGDGSMTVAGANTGNGKWVLGTSDLPGLHIVPPQDYNGSMTVNMTATAWENGLRSGAVSQSQSFAVEVVAQADTPDIEPPRTVAGQEDVGVPIDLGLAHGTTGPHATPESLTLEIVDVPAGASFTLSDNAVGTQGAGGAWTFSAAEVAQIMAAGSGAFKVVPPSNSDESFTLGVRAISTDGDTTASSAGLGDSPYRPVTVAVDAVADAPNISVSHASGQEDQPVALDLSVGLKDLDGSETLSAITVSGIPHGGILSAGTDNGDGSWTLTSGQLPGLTFTAPENESGSWTFSVSAMSTERSNGDTATSSASFTVTVDPVADPPDVSAQSVVADSGAPVTLSLAANLVDSSETLSLTLTGAPEGSLSAGTWDASTSSYQLQQSELTDLTFTPPSGDAAELPMTLTAVSTESNGSTAQSSADFTVTVPDAPVPDTPLVSAMFFLPDAGGDAWNTFLSDDSVPIAGNDGGVAAADQLVTLGSDTFDAGGVDVSGGMVDGAAAGGGLDLAGLGDSGGAGDLIIPHEGDHGAGSIASMAGGI
ncbi:hypothetical protein HEQ62_08330 [Haematospirillum jordaniae]|uniref:Uncharacterized protein n=1 Tax=Haematospirillum jordaniae TaxID=1549855 RepID=A0A143DCS7_9PROT|nr:hypothetical protein [Haematospirillum jordaniae]AMW34476.1 hypothetical protein AY555_03945 [Haematospirillum jordaniae]NKD57823.1 hypothetical protein [Haematospirillum jordaniae]NKD59784.1 hypothetical protein [Haematospirillum jordaniae]NKD67651.1 hypothetical protein [Haematospirillum jordaniae]NKD79815.1 hypothetical protein [Haematospirillum jordaniae]